MIRRIINASAGTGKTYTILEEILKTELKLKADVNEIKQGLKDSVFLSFSKAAVEELKERIHERLAEFSDKGKPDVFDELMGFTGTRVFTIHSFSLELARIFRYELGMPAGVDFIPEGDTTVWKETVEDFYKKEYDSESLRTALSIKTDEENIMFDVFIILGDKYRIKNFVKEKGENVFYVKELGGRTPGPPKKAAIKKLMDIIGIKESDYAKNGKKIQEKLFEKKKELEKFEKEIVPLMEELRKKQDRLAQGYDLKADGTKSKHQINCENAIADMECQINAFLKSTGVLDLFEIMENAGDVLTRLICYIGRERYIPSMMKEGLFDFDAIVFLVIRLIKEKGKNWFFKRLADEDMNMKNLYIDEAQDSDIVQNYLVSVLSGGDKSGINVTVVGDMKQSIYQWRNAYPEEFKAMYDEASKAGCADRLKMSWRVNNGENLDFINDMFDRLREHSDGRWNYEKDRDELTPNPKKIDKVKKRNIRIIRMFKDSDFTSLSKEIEEYIKDGSAGFLVEKKRFAGRSGIMKMLENIKQRIQIENNGKDGILGTSRPELMMVNTAAYTRLSEKLQYLPYLLLFTTPGNFIRNAEKQITGASDIEDMFRILRIFTEKSYETYRESGVARSVYKIMNRYGLWKYMFHGDADKPDDISLDSVRRSINTALASAYLNEKSGDTAIYSKEEMAADTLESGTSPFEWFGLPGSKAKAGDKELTTVHSSKGLQYDNVVVFSDILARIKPETSFKDREYSYLYSADFENVLTDSPDIRVNFYPYFGSVSCKVIKHYYNETKAPWKQGLDYYNKTASKVISENFNVLYVAFTRSKDGLWIVDVPDKKRYRDQNDKKESEMLGNYTMEMATVCGDEEPELDLPQKQEPDEHEPEIFYYELKEKRPLITVKENETEKSVRQLITETHRIKFGGNVKGYEEGFSHISTGTAAHEYVQAALGAIKDMKDYDSEITKLVPEDENEKQAKEIVSSEETKKELEVLNEILKKNKEFRSEVPVWSIADDGMLIKGVVDTLAVTDQGLSVIEYKTVFDDAQAQKQMSKHQLDMYEQMLKPIYKNKPIEKISVILKK